jgi:hypothetical protein
MSLLFLLASIVSLLLGFRRGGLTLVFVSIGCSVLAALFLAASVLRKRSDGVDEEEVAENRVEEWRGSPATAPTTSSEVGEGPRSTESRAGSLATEQLVGVVDRPLAGNRAREPEISLESARFDAGSGVLGPEVVVSSDRRTYHLPGCEQARGQPSSDTMKRAVAKRFGYVPCGVCRPG